jgi:hypothetical protein
VATLQGNEIVISWPTSVSFQLQYRADATQGTWTNELTPPVIVGNQATVRLPVTAATRFFRLVNR